MNAIQAFAAYITNMLWQSAYLVAMTAGIFALGKVSRLRSVLGIGLAVWAFSYFFGMLIFKLTQRTDVFSAIYALPGDVAFWKTTLPQTLAGATTTLAIFLVIYVVFIEPKGRMK